MKNRLWIKLTLSFALVVMVSGMAVLGVLGQVIRRQFQDYVRQGDVTAAQALAPVLGDYYLQTGGWEGLEFYLPSNEPLRRQAPPAGQARGSGMMGMMGMMGPMRQGLDSQRRVIITDLEGRVLVDSSENVMVGRRGRLETQGLGVPIPSGNSRVGFLFLGSMIEPALGALGTSFLTAINRAVIRVVLLSFLFSVAISFFLVTHITRPLSRMLKVSESISGGDFSARLNLKRKDELGDLAAGLDRMAESLQSAEAWKRRIVADSAHELRTPAALIQGNLEMILDGVYQADTARLQSLYDESRHLSRLIADLQELASLEARETPLKRESTDIAALALEASRSFEALVGEKNVNISVVPQADIRVNADSGKLKQVFLNLYANALRYVPPGGWIRVIFEQALEGAAPGILVFVENNGPAIEPDKLEAVFERFFRGEDSRNREEGGRGLGLSICREIVRAHGGEIRAENLPGKQGVRFAFFLPL